MKTVFKTPRALRAIWLLAALSAQNLTVEGQGNAFTYQGRLTDGTGSGNGNYDLRFVIFDAPTNGIAQSGPLTNAPTTISNGLFSVLLDFGAGTFTGADRWLEIGVRTNGGADFATLNPRQKITPSPYAITAGNALGVSGLIPAAQLTGTISSNNIATGSITTVMIAAGAVGSNQLASGGVTTGSLSDGSVTAVKIASTSGNVLLNTFTNPAPAIGDNFGSAVAALGSDRFLIGAMNDDAGATDSGSAYLFSAQGNLLLTITNPTPAATDNFGRRVATVGTDLLLISAPLDDTGATNAGAAYLFSTNGILQFTITNPTPVVGDQFGSSVAALESDRLLIGAPQSSVGASHSGVVHLFRTDGVLITTLTNPVPTNSAQFGTAVASLGSDRILVGALFQKVAGVTAGAAYLLTTNGVLTASFANPQSRVGEFGSVVAGLASAHVLIGAPLNVSGATNGGAAYMYSTNGALETTFTNPAAVFGDQFGVSLAAVGEDRVLIGANQGGSSTNATGGLAYLFATNGALLMTYTNPTPLAGDSFGWAIAAAGPSRVLIGAMGDDRGAASAGIAYLYSTTSATLPYTPGLIADGVRPDSITTADLQDGAVTAAKIGGVLLAGQIPDLDASKITSGTLADIRLSTNVALRSGGNTFSNDQIIASGKLGIGISSPVAKLHVAGDATVNGLFTLSSSTLVPTTGSTLPATNSYLKLNPLSSVTLSGTTAISNGAAVGNLLILQGGSPTFSITVSNAANTRLGSPSRVLSASDTLTLIWDGTDWVELSFSNN